MSKTIQHIWNDGEVSTRQSGFVSIRTGGKDAGRFALKLPGVHLELSPKIAYRLYRVLRKHYEAK